MIRLIIADDHTLVREGIRALLEKVEDIVIVGEAVDGDEVVELTSKLAPDVLVLDIAMPRLTGIKAIKQIRALGLNTQIVILSMHSDDILIQMALQSGVKGYVDKGSVSEDLLLAIRAARRGATYLSPLISETLGADVLIQADEPLNNESFPKLTGRENEILQLIGQGHTNAAIAKLLSVSVKTVERHRANLMGKLNVHNLVGLIRVAIREGLIQLED